MATATHPHEPEHRITEGAEEWLETLWTQEHESGHPVCLSTLDYAAVEDRAPLRELEERKLVRIDGDIVRLTEEGEREAARIVRRHRLAERLLADLLDAREELISRTACRMEHLLHEGLEEAVCTLLGHPKVCPHGKPIPTGKCCEEARHTGMRLVAPLSDLAPGEEGTIAYIHSDDPHQLQRLMAMGVLPGEHIKLLRRSPSFVFSVGHSQFAVDRQIADAIFVRLEA